MARQDIQIPKKDSLIYRKVCNLSIDDDVLIKFTDTLLATSQYKGLESRLKAIPLDSGTVMDLYDQGIKVRTRDMSHLDYSHRVRGKRITIDENLSTLKKEKAVFNEFAKIHYGSIVPLVKNQNSVRQLYNTIILASLSATARKKESTLITAHSLFNF